MNKADLEKLTELRLEEGRLLLENKLYSGAYYLLGYAIECALKACIAKNIREYEFPDKNFVNKIYTHNLEQLLKSAELENKLNEIRKQDLDFDSNWNSIRDWSETSRYEERTQIEAKNLYDSINDDEKGILKWIRQYW